MSFPLDRIRRFARALAHRRLVWPWYEQVAHGGVQGFAEADPAICLGLWTAYNRQITPAKASTPCEIDVAPDMTQSDLALDYVAHVPR